MLNFLSWNISWDWFLNKFGSQAQAEKLESSSFKAEVASGGDHVHSGVSEILAPNNFGSALSKAALKGPLKGALKAVIGRLQLSSWR